MSSEDDKVKNEEVAGQGLGSLANAAGQPAANAIQPEANAPKAELTEDEKLMALLAGDVALDADEQAAMVEYSSDELSLDASDQNEGLGGNLPPLTPVMKPIPGTNDVEVVLPLCYLSGVSLTTNEKPDSKGYFVDQCRTKLRFEFTGFKGKEADPKTGHVNTVEPVSGDLDEKTRAVIIRKQLGFIKDLAETFNCVPLLRSVDIISKQKTLAEAKAAEASGKKFSNAQFTLARYRHTFAIWCLIFNTGRTMPDGTKIPVFVNHKVKMGETDAAGNPANLIPLRLHVIVYDNKWDLAWSPCVERFSPDVKSGLITDISKYQYSKSASATVNNGGGGGGMGGAATTTETAKIDIPTEMNFADLAK